MTRQTRFAIVLPAIVMLTACAGTAKKTETVGPTVVKTMPAVQIGGARTLGGPQQPKFTASEISTMTLEEKIAAYNSGRAPSEQLYCERRMATGSHRKARSCRTGAERDAERQAARRFFRSAR